MDNNNLCIIYRNRTNDQLGKIAPPTPPEETI
jgi:hypothetical protein